MRINKLSFLVCTMNDKIGQISEYIIPKIIKVKNVHRKIVFSQVTNTKSFQCVKITIVIDELAIKCTQE